MNASAEPWAASTASDPVSSAPCAECGHPTIRTAAVPLSVRRREGGYRFAPAMPLCDACWHEVLARRAWPPTWCTGCQSWRPFEHKHDDVAVQAAGSVMR